MKKTLRRLLRLGLTLGLRLRSRRYAPPADGPCVIIAPHPDDETFGCAGLILAHREAGLAVEVVFITDGARSHPDHPRLAPTAIADLRRSEAVRALDQLGVPPAALHFLDAPDGTLAHLAPDEIEALVRRLGALLGALRPAQLCLPCRDDGSSEHEAAFTLTLRALQIARLNPRVLEYPVWARWSPRRLIRPGLGSRRVWRVSFPRSATVKRAAIAAYVSQIQPAPPWPRPVLPEGFASCFCDDEEFFFER